MDPLAQAQLISKKTKEIQDFVKGIKEQIDKINEDILSKVAEIEEQISGIQAGAQEHTQEWVDKNMKKLEKKKQELLEKFETWKQKQLQMIEEWAQNKINDITSKIGQTVIAKANLLM